jgi:mRNA-degrading endonuclease RelE of RelBE toxin-antitoxin system
MSYAVEQTRRFARQYKKLHDNVAADVDTVVELVADKPSIGERKKGDLADLLVYKFHSQGQLYLLGYTLDESIQLDYLEAMGSHENFSAISSVDPNSSMVHPA